ncbi:MAG: N utilization substance protein B, partial [Bacteroidetes bacterium]|nr:N utilization substance protein B [Bacteroidota bacterium]
MSKRRQVRERVLQALYAQEVSQDTADHVLATLIRPVYKDEPAYLQFAERLFLRSLEAREAAEEMIARHIQNWEI